MRIWQVQIWGSGFRRNEQTESFELSGFVSALTADDAFHAAVELAKRDHPELAQAKHPPGPGAVINAEEIQEFPSAPPSQIGTVEIQWSLSYGS
jgi:hypothetical protein